MPDWVKLIARIQDAMKQISDALRAGQNVEQARLIFDAALSEFMRSPILGTMMQVVQNLLQEQLEEDMLSPWEAVQPAKYVLAAYGEYNRTSTALRTWADDKAFGPSIPFIQEPLEVRVPPSEIDRQIAFLSGVFGGIWLLLNRATTEILRVRDARRIGAAASQQPPAALMRLDDIVILLQLPFGSDQELMRLEGVRSLVALPRQPFGTERQKIRDLREVIRQLANQLDQIANEGRRRLEQASLDGRAYSPVAVLGEIKVLNYTVISGLFMCAELARLVATPVGRREQADWQG
jgi:hypothetical protein